MPSLKAKKRPAHKTVRVQALDADVDVEIAPLVMALNHFPNLKTIASCQGDPGGPDGFIDFAYGDDWAQLCWFCFGHLAPHLGDYMDRDVMVTVWQTHKLIFYASLRLRFEAIPEVTRAVLKLTRKYEEEAQNRRKFLAGLDKDTRKFAVREFAKLGLHQ